ncbi:creatininase family protein [Paenibacillus sp. LMG 31461]|uniref:Creatininase family protein n=1 Tax=Paenibacillus plantarum TaxID=2654975 RepID=A0ABX1XBN0_9BACL|nr:creatininase family protein [Paenibacillus plantarum]NOU65786.1 creatininase family protein [Paenibacillus plantarum]
MFSRYEGTAWEARFLPRLSSREIAELPKEKALVILSIGAVEQHGPHLPVMTDALIGEALLTRTMEKLNADLPIWLLPPLAYGKSNEHTGFAGTISLSSSTLQHVILDIAHSLRLSGFHKLLLLNSHGGNVDLLNLVSREIRIATGMTVFYIMPHQLDSFEDILAEEEREFGIHGGDYETSLLKAIKPHWVSDAYAVKEIPDMQKYRYLTLEGKVRFAWKTADISASGVMGDATSATADKGTLFMERITDQLAQALVELCDFDIAQLNSFRTPKELHSQ